MKLAMSSGRIQKGRSSRCKQSTGHATYDAGIPWLRGFGRILVIGKKKS
jgi:hypothetical protein